MKPVVTISRQFGSGGHEIGKKLAEKMGVPFYDKELIDRAVKESGLSAELFENAENKATNSLLYSLTMGMNAYGSHEFGLTNISLDDRVYLAQAEVIQKAAEEGPCVIVGRCADYILRDRKDVINIFIWASMKYRIKQVMESESLSEEKAMDLIHKMDKRRANYYNYHAVEKWGRIENYHLSIQSDSIGLDNSVNCIKIYTEYHL